MVSSVLVSLVARRFRRPIASPSSAESGFGLTRIIDLFAHCRIFSFTLIRLLSLESKRLSRHGIEGESCAFVWWFADAEEELSDLSPSKLALFCEDGQKLISVAMVVLETFIRAIENGASKSSRKRGLRGMLTWRWPFTLVVSSVDNWESELWADIVCMRGSVS